MQEVFANIWSSDVDIICITTNVGVNALGHNIMGGGIAYEAKYRYKMEHDPDELSLEYIYGNSINKYGHHLRYLPMISGKGILAFPTMYRVSQRANLQLIEDSFYQLTAFSNTFPNYKIGLPRPGCNIGGLNWEEEVKPILDEWYPKYEDRIIIYHYPQEGVKSK